MHLLDTNTVSEVRKVRAGKGNPHVATWIDSVPPQTLFLSVISVLEIEIGIRLLDRRDKHQAEMLRYWLEVQLLPSFANRIVEVDVDVCKRCAELHVPNPQPQLDALIAATALTRGLTVVTRNVRDFGAMRVAVLNPWEAA